MGKVCKYCGNTLNDGDNFCQKCGAVAESEQEIKASAATENNQSSATQDNTVYGGKSNGAAIGALVCSLVGILFAAIPLGICAICLSVSATKHIKSFPGEKGKGLAVAGLVIGIIDIVLGVIGIIAKSLL